MMRIAFIGDDAAFVSLAATVVFLALIGWAVVRTFVRACWPDLRAMGPRAAIELVGFTVLAGPVFLLQRGMERAGDALTSWAHALEDVCQRQEPRVRRLFPALIAWVDAEAETATERAAREFRMDLRRAGLRQTGGAA